MFSSSFDLDLILILVLEIQKLRWRLAASEDKSWVETWLSTVSSFYALKSNSDFTEGLETVHKLLN